MKIGAQFYTLRDYCKDLDGLSESLKKVADIGYTTVQISGTCPFEAEWLKKELDKNGLECVVTHTAPARLKGELDKVIAEHTVFGCDNIGLGCYAFLQNEEYPFDAFFDTYLPIAEKIKESGKYFMYHNHAHEFMKYENKLIIEHIMERFPKENLGFILDTFWVQAGGADPAEWLNILSGRVPCIHLKDYAYDGIKGERKMAVIGEGNINFDRVFKEAQKAGTKYMLVEQDDCYGENPFDCLKRSYDFLRSRGFE